MDQSELDMAGLNLNEDTPGEMIPEEPVKPPAVIEKLIEMIPPHNGPDMQSDRGQPQYDYIAFMEKMISDERAAAFGDGRNDIDMLRAVPQSWAMANAPAEVRAAAARVTALDNDHDGLAETIFSLLED